jgi:D-alanyl-D-alanine carboxypeptidase/D-alanyl-D-alanine-endopeptidase (penicillin-binding protein 4)
MTHSSRQQHRALIVSTFCASLLVLFTWTASQQFKGHRAQGVATREEKAGSNQTRAEPTANRSVEPPVVSNSRAAVELGRRIDETIRESEFARAHWGVFVMSLKDRRVLYARNPEKLFTPASNMKVYTTAPALDLLGADYRWRTSVYADREQDQSGTINGDLVLYGRGAPNLSSREQRDEPNHLAALADELYKRGVRRVEGGVVGDESYLKGEALGDGWLWNDIQWYFGAEVSALTINSNEATLTITPAAKSGEAATLKLNTSAENFRLINDTNTAAGGTALTIGVTRGLSDNEVRVWGDFPAGGRSYNVRLSVHKPALWAARLFREALRARGITVEGEARTRDARVSEKEKFNLERAVELASVTSKTLGEIARETNKQSLNLQAELILRTLGKERGADAPDPDPVRMRIRGDDQAGVAVVRQWLERAGVPTRDLALHDGSGLSRLDLVSPEATARLLAAMSESKAGQAFRDSLPIAGRDGTLSGRLRSAAGRILAKTGTLTYTNSLSGYATTADGETLAFAIICNDETTKASSTVAIDAIAVLLANYRE